VPLELGYHTPDVRASVRPTVAGAPLLVACRRVRGPVDPITSHAGKLFASGYALFSGLLFIGAASLVITPFVHRIMHKLHLEED